MINEGSAPRARPAVPALALLHTSDCARIRPQDSDGDALLRGRSSACRAPRVFVYAEAGGKVCLRVRLLLWSVRPLRLLGVCALNLTGRDAVLYTLDRAVHIHSGCGERVCVVAWFEFEFELAPTRSLLVLVLVIYIESGGHCSWHGGRMDIWDRLRDPDRPGTRQTRPRPLQPLLRTDGDEDKGMSSVPEPGAGMAGINALAGGGRCRCGAAADCLLLALRSRSRLEYTVTVELWRSSCGRDARGDRRKASLYYRLAGVRTARTRRTFGLVASDAPGCDCLSSRNGDPSSTFADVLVSSCERLGVFKAKLEAAGGVKFSRRKFGQVLGDGSPPRRYFYFHFTTATDAKTTSTILRDVQGTVVLTSLQKSNRIGWVRSATLSRRYCLDCSLCVILYPPRVRVHSLRGCFSESDKVGTSTANQTGLPVQGQPSYITLVRQKFSGESSSISETTAIRIVSSYTTFPYQRERERGGRGERSLALAKSQAGPDGPGMPTLLYPAALTPESRLLREERAALLVDVEEAQRGGCKMAAALHGDIIDSRRRGLGVLLRSLVCSRRLQQAQSARAALVPIFSATPGVAASTADLGFLSTGRPTAAHPSRQ
ncbi:hypothetical protein BKA93DRAFT_754520 [Sparassis latifolia]